MHSDLKENSGSILWEHVPHLHKRLKPFLWLYFLDGIWIFPICNVCAINYQAHIYLIYHIFNFKKKTY